MKTKQQESAVSPTYRGSVELKLDNRVATPTEVCMIKVQPGNKGDLVGYLRSGKIVILPERGDWIEGYALVELEEERERVAFARKAIFCMKPTMSGAGFMAQMNPQPSVNFAAVDAEQFLAEVRALISERAEEESLKQTRETVALYDALKAEREEEEHILEVGGELGVELLKALRSHDWHHDYSDDSKVWARGKAELKEIKELLKAVSPGIGRELWEKHAPEGFAFP